MDKSTTAGGRRYGEPAAIGDIVETLPLGEAVARWQREQAGNQSDDGARPGNHNARATDPPPGPAQTPTVVRRRGRPRRVIQQDEDYQVLQAYMADFARELNDRAPLKASTTRLYNLLKRSGVGRDAFVDRLYAARAIVKERTGGIHSRGADSPLGPTKHKAAYFFAVLEDLLGLKAEPGGGRPAGTPAP